MTFKKCYELVKPNTVWTICPNNPHPTSLFWNSSCARFSLLTMSHMGNFYVKANFDTEIKILFQTENIVF